jgi:hypothetical protein
VLGWCVVVLHVSNVLHAHSLQPGACNSTCCGPHTKCCATNVLRDSRTGSSQPQASNSLVLYDNGSTSSHLATHLRHAPVAGSYGAGSSGWYCPASPVKYLARWAAAGSQLVVVTPAESCWHSQLTAAVSRAVVWLPHSGAALLLLLLLHKGVANRMILPKFMSCICMAMCWHVDRSALHFSSTLL